MLKNKLHPQYVRGVIDAEGCFYIRKKKYNSNRVSFRIYNKNIEILKLLKDFFKDAYLYKNTHGSNKDVSELVMQSKNQIKILLDFFEEYGNPIIKDTNRPRNLNSITTFNDWKVEAIQYINKKSNKYPIALKIDAIKQRKLGKTYKEIAELLNVSTSTIYNWTK